jgi:hypothetical protein
MKEKSLPKNQKLKFSSTGVSPVRGRGGAVLQMNGNSEEQFMVRSAHPTRVFEP